jgi:hypothetical protein
MNTSKTYLHNKLTAQTCALVLVLLMLAGAALLWPTRAAFAQNDNSMQAPAEALVTENASRGKSKVEDVETAEQVSTILPEAVTATTYPFTSSAGVPLEDMSTGTTQLVGANLDDTASAVTDIGFDFWLDGVRFAQFSVNANGLCRLGTVVIGTTFTNSLASTTNSPQIAPYWDDLRTGTNGKVHYKVVGSAPNRKLIVEWLNEQIPRGSAGATGAGTFQMWLFETTGVIEFVYGTGVVVNSTNGGYSVGLQSGVATNFASVTTSVPSVSYAAANDTQTNAITAGTAYIFTPNVPAAPTGLSFAPVAGTTIQLNWTDNATNEVGYVIYRSTDGVNYTFIAQTAANATSYNDTGLQPTTTYFYRVHAVTEGALSTPALSGSQVTPAAGNISSTAAGGNWSSAATWVGGVVPTASDNVTIVDAATVTIDVTTAACLNLTVGQGTSGVLQYAAGSASTLTAGADVTVSAGGTFTAGSGVLLTHVLNIGGNSSGSVSAGNLTVSGIFDMNTTAGVTTNFFGSTDGTLSGTGATCDFFAIVMNKGSSITPTLDVTRVITIGAPAASANRLNTLNGTFKLSSASALTPWFGSQTLVAATGRLWINNANATVTVVGVGTGTGAGAPTINGTLRVDHGTFGYGSGNNTMTIGAAGTLIIGGADATVNQFGAVSFTTGATFTMTAGNFNVDPQAANNLAATTNIVRFNSVNVAFTGGTLTIVDPHAATGTGVALSISTSNGATFNFVGSTISFGDGVSTTAGSVDGFDLDTFVGLALVPIGNVVVNNTATNAATRFVRAANALSPFTQLYGGNLTITNAGGSEFRLNGHLVGVSGNIINNGTINGTVASSRLYFLGAGSAQTYSGTGTSVTPLQSFDVDNPLGVTIDPAVTQIVTLRIILFSGGITNTNKLTLGNGGATSGIVQIGNTTTATAAGTLDVAPVFNLGTAGEIVSYLRTTTSRTTGNEINPSRTLASLTYDDNDVTHTLTIAGGDLTVTGTTTLTNGRIVTGSNALAIGSAGTVTRTAGYVDGNLRKTYAAAASKVFEVGTANGYSPVTVNATAGTFPADFTAKATQGPQPAVNPATSIQRYWTLNATGITADLTFQYLATDVMGTEANYRVIRVIGGTSVSFPTSTVNTGTHTATLTGVSVFSDWTVGETSAPTAAPATIRGQVTTPEGMPLGGVIVNLGGSQSARTITDGNGLYRFDNVETNKLYIVRPDRANYTFSPSERVFALNADKTDAVFTATPDSVQTANPLDTDMYFVRQQYLDFLGREPDKDGLLYWTSELDRCGTDAACLSSRRIGVAAAFFKEKEYQETGSYVYRLYKGALGRQLSYDEFSTDRKQVIGGDDLETSKETFANAFVLRPEFTQKYDQATGAESFVDTLLASIQQTSGADLSGQRSAIIESYNGGVDLNQRRSLALRKAIDVAAFKDAEYNPSFVLMEYFGYLKRDPEKQGFDFWLNVLNNKEPNNYLGMVCSFITSAEYQQRFSAVTTHSNRECR